MSIKSLSLIKFPVESSTLTDANDGLSVLSGVIKLGQVLSASGNPAALTEDREVPLSGHNFFFSDTAGSLGLVFVNSLAINGYSYTGDGSPANSNSYAAPLITPTANYSYGNYIKPFVTAEANFYGHEGLGVWSYVIGSTIGTGHGKFHPYICGVSSSQVWDGSGGTGGNILPVNLGFLSALSYQSGGGVSGYDFYAAEINTVGSTTANPPVTTHYGLFMEQFSYATNNYGIYINGTQTNYLGGKLGIGETAPSALIHLKAGTATAGTSPLKLAPGVILTTPESGAIETDGTHLYWTDNTGTRHTIV